MWQPLVLLLTIFITCRARCPSMCICKHFPREAVPKSYLYYTVVKCEGFVENGTLSNTTRVLEVSSLDEESFGELMQTLSESDLPDLNTVVLSSGFVGNVSDILQVVGSQIDTLVIIESHLTSLHDLEKFNYDTLVSLDLSRNSLTGLPTVNLKSLQYLNLSANAIQSISSKSFRNLTSLKALDLSQNGLSSLDSSVFQSLYTLQYLNISHNKLEILTENCFSTLVNLWQLDLSWNNLARVAPGSLQLQSLTRLVLAGNVKLSNSSEVILDVGAKLHTVDASGLGLERVPGTLTHSIRILRLAKNRISVIRCGELDAYPLLQSLDLASNGLVSIQDDAMGRQEFLSVLYLSDNKLKSIPRRLPEELTVLHLECNTIQKVSGDDLQGLPNLEVLLLNDNKITALESGAFRHLGSLVTLDLSRNSIKELLPGSLSGPLALQILRLSGVDVVAPAKDVTFPLPDVDRLTSLDLSGSVGLVFQFLADSAALAGSKELQELDISGASLKYIRPDLLHFLPELRVLHVHNNQLNCSNLQWLAAWFRRQDHNEYQQIICASPPELWGMPLLDLQYTELSPIKQINHSTNEDFERESINLVATKKSNPLGKYGLQRISAVTNDAKNNPVNTTTSIIIDKAALRTHSLLDNKKNNGKVIIQDQVRLSSVNEETKEDNFISKRVSKDMEVVKTLNEILVSSTDVGLSSLIPVSNEAKAYYHEGTTSKSLTESNHPGIHILDELQPTSEPYDKEQPSPALNTTLSSNEAPPSHSTSVPDYENYKSKLQPFIDTNMTDNGLQPNAFMVNSSMYKNENLSANLWHPGMLILTAGILCAAITLVTMAIRFNHRKRWIQRSENLDDSLVVGISSVTELW